METKSAGMSSPDYNRMHEGFKFAYTVMDSMPLICLQVHGRQ
jgi:hypothetical protein